jgi:hypothetical protein
MPAPMQICMKEEYAIYINTKMQVLRIRKRWRSVGNYWYAENYYVSQLYENMCFCLFYPTVSRPSIIPVDIPTTSAHLHGARYPSVEQKFNEEAGTS